MSVHVPFQELDRYLVESSLHRGDPSEQLLAIFLHIQHVLNTPHMSLNAIQMVL